MLPHFVCQCATPPWEMCVMFSHVNDWSREIISKAFWKVNYLSLPLLPTSDLPRKLHLLPLETFDRNTIKKRHWHYLKERASHSRLMKIKRLMRSCAFEMELDHCDRKCASNASLQWLIAVAVPGQNSISHPPSPPSLPLLLRECVCATQAGERVSLQLGRI